MGPKGKKFVLVSSGLHRRGGGVAVVGRLTGRALAALCEREERPFEALDLGPPEAVGIPNIRAFDGSQGKLAVALAMIQLERSAGALVFDHVGPARVQAWLPKRLRTPYAVWLHGIEVWRPLTGDRRAALEAANLLVSNSQFTWDRAIEFNPWLARRPYRVVHLAAEERVSVVSPLRLAQAPYFLMVGRLSAAERYKGHDETIEAFARIAPEFPDAQLVIAGDGDDRGRLAALAARVPGNPVKLLGFVSDEALDRLVSACRALVLPSRSEGFGLVYVEALRHGRPFVACSGTVAEEVAGGADWAFLVPPGDVDALARCLRGLLDDAARCDVLGEVGRAAVSERFTEAAFLRRLTEAVRLL